MATANFRLRAITLSPIDSLPAIHKDAFDGVLIAEAMVEGVTLLTTDSLLTQYPGSIRVV